MKSFVILGVLCSLAAVNCELDPDIVRQLKDALKQNVLSCASLVGASSEDTDAIFLSRMPQTPKGRCILFCVHKVFNVQRDDGSLDQEGAMTTIEVLKEFDMDLYEDVSKVFRACFLAPFDADPCIYAVNLAECAVAESKKVGLREAIFE